MAHEYRTHLSLFIDGERLGQSGRATHRVVNPATGDALGELPLATAQDLDRALAMSAQDKKTFFQTNAEKVFGL